LCLQAGDQLNLTASTSRGRGNADGSDLTYTHTQLKAGEQILLSSGGDTTLNGAVVQAPRIDAQVGGHLLIQSLQDTSTYTSQQKSSGGSITVGTAGVSGSVNAGKSNINSQYTSVTEQSGLRAGDGGFNVNVQGNTRLVGGAITSTQAAIDHGKNTFQTAGQSAQQAINSGTLTLSDLHNQASYSASSSVNLGTGFSPQGKLTPQGTGAGWGKDSGQASSVTQSAISGMAGNTAARTGDADTGINKIFDADRVQKEINAQTQITQMFGQQAPKAAAEFAQNRAKALRAEGNEDEAKQWDEGGAYRVVLHTTIGALSGGSSGAAGGFASASTAPLLNAFQDQLTQNLKDAGANDKVAQSAGQLIASLTVAGIGAAASGGSVAGAAVAFNIDANNRQLHPTERQLARQLARKSQGKYSVEQIEDALRNSGHSGRGETVVTGMLVPLDGSGTPIIDGGAEFILGGDGKTLVQVLPNNGQVDPSLAAFIQANTGGTQSPYAWLDPQLGKGQLPPPTSTNSSGPRPAANGCVTAECAAGIAPSRPELRDEERVRNDIAEMAGTVSRGAGVVASTSTVVATFSPEPTTKSTAAVVAGISTGVGFVADVVEQAARPDVGRGLNNLLAATLQEQLDRKLPIAAPLTNEAFEYWKKSGSSQNFETWVNSQWNSFLKERGVKK
jgi:filamentous hemagglutinin